MTTLSTSAGTVAYDSHGSGDPIVLLPSGGHEQHDYDEIRELLPDGLRSIGVDWPGHGQSPAGPAAPTELRLTHLPHTTSPAAVAAELASLANSAFGGSRTNRPQNRTPATKEQQQ